MGKVKKAFYCLFVFYFLSACGMWKYWVDPQPVKDSTDAEKMLLEDIEISDRQILGLMTYVDKSYEWRVKAISTYQKIKAYRESQHGRISSKDLLDMHNLAIVYVRRIKEPLTELMLSDYYFVNLDLDIKIQTDKESYIEHGVIRYEDSMGRIVENEEGLKEEETYQEFKVDVYHINPLDLKGQVFLRSFKVSFAAALVLLDNYVLGLEPFLNDKILRRSLFIDIPDSRGEIRKALRKIWLDYNKKYKNSIKLIQAFDLYQKFWLVTEDQEVSGASPYLDELDNLIQNSFAFEKLEESPRGEGFVKRLITEIKLFIKRRRDDLFKIRRSATHILSKLFGESVGIFKIRNGKLNNMPEDKYQDLISKMKPLDILLEKTPFRLTDKFIPGHYGHVAVWVGTESDLKEVGIWETLPHVYKIAKERYSYDGPSFQESIQSGKHIIEALRPGVEINSMRHFLDIDDLAVLRPKECAKGSAVPKLCLTLKDKRLYLLEAFRQIGKDYDFNFDVNTEKKIVCSEIAYRTFLNIDFEATKTFGKYSISPDQVALKADEKEDPFYPALLYFNGKPVSGEVEFLREVFKLILKRDYQAVENIIGDKASDK